MCMKRSVEISKFYEFFNCQMIKQPNPSVAMLPVCNTTYIRVP